jgi:monofunctional biosynthetic peptidoglycan transglycosylase
MKTSPRASLLRFVALVALALVALQIYFALRIAVMAVVDPASTSFQRSEIWRLLSEKHTLGWSQRWVDDARLSSNLKRAVIASEDAGFAEHNGVDWDALEKAWERNQKAQTRAEAINARAEAKAPRKVEPKVIGGSTITQQLAKNLFLSSERHLLRKAQEFVLTFMLEAMLDKRRILEIYLNSVEWGEGIFGAEAAAQHYFHTSAAQLTPMAAARLAVMLPAPKRFEKRPDSPYLQSRAATVLARMGAVELP